MVYDEFKRLNDAIKAKVIAENGEYYFSFIKNTVENYDLKTKTIQLQQKNPTTGRVNTYNMSPTELLMYMKNLKIYITNPSKLSLVIDKLTPDFAITITDKGEVLYNDSPIGYNVKVSYPNILNPETVNPVYALNDIDRKRNIVNGLSYNIMVRIHNRYGIMPSIEESRKLSQYIDKFLLKTFCEGGKYDKNKNFDYAKGIQPAKRKIFDMK